MQYRVVEYASDSGNIRFKPQYRPSWWPLWFSYREDGLWIISFTTKDRALQHIETMQQEVKIHNV